MADKKISELPVATTPLSGTEKAEILQGGVNKQTTLQDIADIAGDEHFKGVYASEAALVLAHATAEPGDYAYVDAGVANPTELWLWDDDDEEWVQTGSAALPTATQVTFTPAGNIAATDVQAALEELDSEKQSAAQVAAAITAALSAAKSIVVAVTDEVTNISAGTSKVSFRMPYAMTLTAVRASLVVAQASGSIFTVDINEGGTSILSTKLTIDNTATTSVGATTPAVISDTALADNALITVDVDQIGNGSAIGLKIALIGQ